jgi:hypothetical protein
MVSLRTSSPPLDGPVVGDVAVRIGGGFAALALHLGTDGSDIEPSRVGILPIRSRLLT